MKVFRVAHKEAMFDGFPAGPYACNSELPTSSVDALRDMRWDHCDDAHPSPLLDSTLGGIADWERCGFDSLEALYEWFDGWVERLIAAGFVMWVYEVPPDAVRVGKRGQAVFDKYDAVELDKAPLTTAVQIPLFDEEECGA
jgi:hypothetical protein